MANGLEDEVVDAFLNRPRQVENADGFVRLEVLHGADDPKEFCLITHWRDRAAYDTWYRSHGYKDVHKSMPDGLKVVPGSVQIRVFLHFAT